MAGLDETMFPCPSASKKQLWAILNRSRVGPDEHNLP